MASSPRASPTYYSINHAAITPELVSELTRHAAAVWIGMPLCVFGLAFAPLTAPDCERGYSRLSFILAALLVAHHFYSESRCWALAKSLATPPEVTVMRNLGVLAQRRRLVAAGILEDLDIFTDVSFPLMARSCDLQIADAVMQSWSSIPLVGVPLATWMSIFRFWGTSLLMSGLLAAAGIWGILQMIARRGMRAGKADNRMYGEDWVALACYAQMALMPSVSLLCEEMAEQKRNVFDGRKDARERTQVVELVAWGKVMPAEAEAQELSDAEESGKVIAAAKRFRLIYLIVKVLIGNLISLLLQSVFLELSYDSAGNALRMKLLCSIGLSATQVVLRGMRSLKAVTSLGFLGVLFGALNVSIVAWAAAHVYFAWECPDHVWNIAVGCLQLHEDYS